LSGRSGGRRTGGQRGSAIPLRNAISLGRRRRDRAGCDLVSPRCARGVLAPHFRRRWPYRIDDQRRRRHAPRELLGAPQRRCVWTPPRRPRIVAGIP
jgi:hypothetical protein